MKVAIILLGSVLISSFAFAEPIDCKPVILKEVADHYYSRYAVLLTQPTVEKIEKAEASALVRKRNEHDYGVFYRSAFESTSSNESAYKVTLMTQERSIGPDGKQAITEEQVISLRDKDCSDRRTITVSNIRK